MRIGLDVHVLTGPHQGTTSVWGNLLDELPGTHEYVLYSFDPASVAALFPQPHFIHRPIPRLPAFARIQFGFPVMTRRDGCDVFHANYFGPLFGGPPMVLHVHDLIYLDFPQFSTGARRLMFATLGRASAHAAARVVTVSQWAKQRILERYALTDDAVEVIPTGLDQSWVSPAEEEIEAAWQGIRHRLPRRYALAVGRIDPRKNFALTARAVRALVDRNLLDGLVIVGPQDFGGDQFWSDLTRDATRSLVTHLVGLSRQTLQSIYRHASCLLYLSLAEGFGLPLIEAMAMRTPIVTSNRTAIPEIVGDAGIVVDPDRLDDVVEAAATVLTNGTERERIVANGTRRLDLFDSKETARQMIGIYERVAE